MLKRSNNWGLIINSVADGTRPAAAWGTSITPGNNAYGSYASVIAGASVTHDAYGILININSNSVAATIRDALVTIGFDPAGGTSFGGLGGVTGREINHLLASCAPTYTLAVPGVGGISYFFPLKIPAGTSIGAKASVNNATVGTLRVSCKLFCKPSAPELVRVGSYVKTFGETTASSRGTAFTPGGASEGTYVQLGSAIAAADSPLWYWECGIGIDNTAITANVVHVDVGLGDATNKRIAIDNQWFGMSTNETIGKAAGGAYQNGAAGDLVYVRGQSGPAGPDTGFTAIAYGVGG